jgi:hypothetical protein
MDIYSRAIYCLAAAAAAWQQRGGSVAGNETEARWWRQLSFS